jgi:hypothetical protein
MLKLKAEQRTGSDTYDLIEVADPVTRDPETQFHLWTVLYCIVSISIENLLRRNTEEIIMATIEGMLLVNHSPQCYAKTEALMLTFLKILT